MSYPYYAPFYRPTNYYNTSILQEQNPQNQPYQQPAQTMPMQQPMQAMPMATPTPQNDMIWVLSEVEAQSYPVAPNNSVILWDKNNDVIYIKSANMQGVPSMRILDYTERTAPEAPQKTEKHVCTCGKDFARKDDFEAFCGQLEALKRDVESMKEKLKAKTAKPTKTEDENDG